MAIALLECNRNFCPLLVKLFNMFSLGRIHSSTPNPLPRFVRSRRLAHSHPSPALQRWSITCPYLPQRWWKVSRKFHLPLPAASSVAESICWFHFTALGVTKSKAQRAENEQFGVEAYCIDEHRIANSKPLHHRLCHYMRESPRRIGSLYWWYYYLQ
jgi:hypothetical protein